MKAEMSLRFALLCSEKKSNRKQTHASRDEDKNEYHGPAEILFPCSQPQPLGRRRDDSQPRQPEHTKGKDVPSRNQFGREASATPENQKDRNREKDRKKQPMSGVDTGNPIQGTRHKNALQ